MKSGIIIKKKKGWKAFCFSKPMLIVLLVLIFFLGRGVITMFMRAHNAQEKLEEERIELQRAQVRHDQLSADLELLRTDFGKEELVRQKFNVVKPGEEMIKLIDADKKIVVPVEEDRSFVGGIFDWTTSWFRD